VRDALRALQQRRTQDALELELLRAKLAVGDAALSAGDAEQIDDADLETYLAGLGASVRRRSR
jgi:Arc/MetJ-type ribon-helix-helix transcriptional regulator